MGTPRGGGRSTAPGVSVKFVCVPFVLFSNLFLSICFYVDLLILCFSLIFTFLFGGFSMVGTYGNVRFISGGKETFSDKDSSRSVDFYRGVFVQDGDGSTLSLTVDEDVFLALTPMQVYNLDVETRSFNNRIRNKVVGCCAV